MVENGTLVKCKVTINAFSCQAFTIHSITLIWYKLITFGV